MTLQQNSPAPVLNRTFNYASLQTLQALGSRSNKRFTRAEEEQQLLEELKEAKAPPDGRYSLSCIFLEKLAFFFFGKGRKSLLSSCVSFHFASKTWKEIPLSIKPRWQHTTVLYKNFAVILGGLGEDGKPLNDLYFYDIASASGCIEKKSIPLAVAGHSAVVLEDEMFVFGGKGLGSRTNNLLWKYDFGHDAWTQITGDGLVPSPRYSHCMFQREGLLYVYGGVDGYGRPLNDFHKFIPSQTTWDTVEQTGPTPPIAEYINGVYMNNSFFLTLKNRRTNNIEIYELSFDTRRWSRFYNSSESGSYQGSIIVTKDRLLYIFFGLTSSDELNTSILKMSLPTTKTEVEENVEEEGLNRSAWLGFAMRNHPSLLELRERTRIYQPGGRSFSQKVWRTKGLKEENDIDKGKTREIVELYHLSERTDSKSALSCNTVLQLIMEYLSVHNKNQIYKKTVESIQEESNVLYVREPYTQSRLLSILRIAMKRLKGKSNIFASDLFDDLPHYEESLPIYDHLSGRTDLDKDHDVNIWEEGPEVHRKNMMRLKVDGQMIIRAGTLNKLVEALLPEQGNWDVSFAKVLFSTHLSFVSSEKLLSKIVQRYNVPVLPDEKAYLALKETMAKKVCDVIKFWIEKYHEDLSERCVASILSFIDGKLNNEWAQHAKILKATLTKYVFNKAKASNDFSNVIFAVTPPEPIVNQKIFSRHLKLFDVNEEEIARQLCLIEFKAFASIRPHELFPRAHDSIRNKSQNINEINDRRRDLKNWIISNIENAEKMKLKVKIVEYVIKISEHLRNNNNFETLFNMMSALTSMSVHKTGVLMEIQFKMKEVYDKFLELRNIVNDEKYYRDLLDKTKPPAIPSLEYALLDFEFIDNSYPDNINNLINFQKRIAQNKLLVGLQKYKQTPYNFQPVHQIISYIQKRLKSNEPEKLV
eukprot:TRINITY_DN7472_c0_g1_i1.p1 TRINITY_DN7472_c0_g1~~TRINITY_DN7472_c0_g1_i1.p1  ORF type:complete len:928 (+),score=140.22 TRINITY_DN7472_c0_g1_i1:91-2874(+)